MSNNKIRRLILSLAVILMLVTACSNQPVTDNVEIEKVASEEVVATEEIVATEEVVASEDLVPMDLSIALSSTHVWIQPVIAQCQGFYEKVGLNVEIVRFTSGRAAMDALIGGQTDLATTAISPAIFAAFQGQPVAILAENASFPGEKITARVESGIATPADLAGKKIGVQLGSDVHFFLISFLNHYGLTEDDVEIVNLTSTDMVFSLARGDIDAFASWKPQPDKAKEEMGDGAIFLEQPDPPFFESLYLIVGMQELVEKNPEAYVRFMEAMILADEYAAANPDGVKQCIADITEIDLDTAAELMDGYVFKIKLDQSLIAASENRAEWQIENNLSPEGVEMPDFRKFIVEGPLQTVDPDRVLLD